MEQKVAEEEAKRSHQQQQQGKGITGRQQPSVGDWGGGIELKGMWGYGRRNRSQNGLFPYR